jgi:hypothetical protein
VDYYQGVVVDFLRATRTRFVNTECLIQLHPAGVPDKGSHWYCDAVTVDFGTPTPSVYLCEITYSKTLAALFKRLDAWRAHWTQVKNALVRDCGVQAAWPVRPWVFVPRERKPLLERKFPVAVVPAADDMPHPRVEVLEEVVPWKFRDWNGIPYAAAVEQLEIRNK